MDEDQCKVFEEIANFWKKSERESEEVFEIFRSRMKFCYD
jgi:hypothetical protein